MSVYSQGPVPFRTEELRSYVDQELAKIAAALAIAPVPLQRYTVATLPTVERGHIAYVTDAAAPAYNATVVGGGAVVISVFFNGTNWVCM